MKFVIGLIVGAFLMMLVNAENISAGKRVNNRFKGNINNSIIECERTLSIRQKCLVIIIRPEERNSGRFNRRTQKNYKDENYFGISL